MGIGDLYHVWTSFHLPPCHVIPIFISNVILLCFASVRPRYPTGRFAGLRVRLFNARFDFRSLSISTIFWYFVFWFVLGYL